MRMPKAFALVGILAAVAGAFTALASCSSPDGATPGCVNNINAAGFMYPAQNGCYSFATCPMGDPKNCCVSAGVPLTGNALAECLYGYGACAQFTVKNEPSGIVETCNTSVVTGGTGGSGASTGPSGTGGSGASTGPSGAGGAGGSSNGAGG